MHTGLCHFAENESRELWFRYRSCINLLFQQVQRAAVSITACQVRGPEKQRGVAIPLSAVPKPLQKHTDNILMHVATFIMIMEN